MLINSCVGLQSFEREKNKRNKRKIYNKNKTFRERAAFVNLKSLLLF